MSRPFYIKQTKSGRVFDAFNIVLMILVLVAVEYPFVNVLAISFNDGYDAVRGVSICGPECSRWKTINSSWRTAA